MKKILVLFRFDPGHPTGITRLVRNLCTQLADRDCEVLLAMPAVEKTFIHYKQVWEEFADSAGKVSVQWWDGAEFTPGPARTLDSLG